MVCIMAFVCFFIGFIQTLTAPMVLAGVSTNLIFTGTAIFLFFASLPFMNTCADVLVRVSIPNELQGRVWGMISLLTQAGTVLAYASCGLLADYVFEPMLSQNGVLAGSIGNLIGTGKGRGIGFVLILSGIGMIIASVTIGYSKGIRMIQVKKETD